MTLHDDCIGPEAEILVRMKAELVVFLRESFESRGDLGTIFSQEIQKLMEVILRDTLVRHSGGMPYPIVLSALSSAQRDGAA